MQAMAPKSSVTARLSTALAISVKDWCKIFQAQGTENYTSSVIFMKQLTMIAISTISYVKSVFPEDCFTEESFAGMKLTLLKEKCNDDWAQFVSSSLRHAFEALEKKYLHQLALCFYEGDRTAENLLEYHIFEYSYSEEGIIMNINSNSRYNEKQPVKCTFDSVRGQTLSLIKQCIVIMNACGQTGLSPSSDISIRLYYNDNAPADYQAPGFYSDDDAKDHLEPTLPDAMELGWVQTPYHKLVAKSYAREAAVQDSNEAVPSQNPPTMTQQSLFVQGSMSDAPMEEELTCPCKKYEDIGSYKAPLLIKCTYCGTMQHAACFGVLPARVTSLHAHCCTHCSETDPRRQPTDPLLSKLTVRKRESYCMFRRTLEWCSQLSAISASNLIERFGMSRPNAARLMNVLHSNGIVNLPTEHDIETPMKIDPENLDVQICRVFQVSEQMSLADRLLAETLGSQESQHDPISEVLSPIEKISLQQASNRDRVIQNTPMVVDNNDVVMKQYRDVIMSKQPSVHLEDLPLSAPNTITKDTEKVKKGKRKMNDAQEAKTEKRLRSGVRNRKARDTAES